MGRGLVLLLLAAMELGAAKRILFITHSAGYEHDSIPAAVETLKRIGARTQAFDVDATADLSRLNAETLRSYDAIFFFTSGNLVLSDQQRRDVLDFVRSGKGFGGAHSATDTSYDWPEYGELIGGYFDNHPWVKEVSIDIEDPTFPGLSSFVPRFSITEEIYQIRNFSRDRVRVLMTLDTQTVDLGAEGVKRTDGDFALAWCRTYGDGRVFYTALGHFIETWRDSRFERMMEGAVLWMIGDAPADATPRSGTASALPQYRIEDVMSPVHAVQAHSPGAVVAIYGRDLTSGSAVVDDDARSLRLAGSRVLINGKETPLMYVSPVQINAVLPVNLEVGRTAELMVCSVNRCGNVLNVAIAEASPALLSAVRSGSAIRILATGLGRTTQRPVIRLNGAELTLEGSTLQIPAIGLYEIRVTGSVPAEGGVLQLEIAGIQSNPLTFR